MNKCSAVNGFNQCQNNGVWTLTVRVVDSIDPILTESKNTCGTHMRDAFAYLLQACDNAVDGDVTITVHWNP